jgi:hypothetical protein
VVGFATLYPPYGPRGLNRERVIEQDFLLGA